jgi:hypothetical protein
LKVAKKIYEEWLATVKEYGQMLKFVPEKLMTQELCHLTIITGGAVFLCCECGKPSFA